MKYIIGLLTAGLLLFGCSKEGGHEETHEMHEHADDHSGHDHGDEGHEGHGHDDHEGHDHEVITGITLNNGEKWEADKHTNDKVAEMKNELAEYKKSKNYKKLTTNLEADVKELIKGCTMDGESHNQLHHWLEPYLGLVRGMNKASNDAEKLSKVEEIEKSLNNYTEYFK